MLRTAAVGWASLCAIPLEEEKGQDYVCLPGVGGFGLAV